MVTIRDPVKITANTNPIVTSMEMETTIIIKKNRKME
jgi:hypothetical protein